MYCGVSYGAGKINAISFDSKDNEGENYLMDVAMDGGLGHGGTRPGGVNKQQFTFAIHNPKQVSDKNKVGYLEVIIDTSSAKSILVSESKSDKVMKENIANNKVTSPEIYGQYKDSGIGFYIRGKDGRADLRLGTNFGRCSADPTHNTKLAELKKYVADAEKYNATEAKKHEICQEDKVETIVDSTAKQFRVVIPDNLCENGKCLNNNFAYLVFKTDTFYRDCKKEAKTKDQFNASKSNFYGIRLSVKHSTEKYTGATNFVTGIGASASAQSGSGTYNLPTLIIGREDEYPSLYTKEMENKNNNKQLLWAACGEAEDIKNEVDCRKSGASCTGRIGEKRDGGEDGHSGWHADIKVVNEPTKSCGDGQWYYNCVEHHFTAVYDDKSSYWGDDYHIDFPLCPPCLQDNLQIFGAYTRLYPRATWEKRERKDSIYSSGYRWTFGDVRHTGQTTSKAFANTMWAGIACRSAPVTENLNPSFFEYEVKAPKLFTISLREYANRNDNSIDHENIPAFEAKFRIVNASTEVGKKQSPEYQEWTIKKNKKSFFKDEKITCYFLDKNDNKIGNDVKIDLEGLEDEPTFTINTRDRFSPSDSIKGKRIQCRFDLSDIGHTGYSKDNYDNKGLYNEFAYNIQLASLKILGTKDASYKDLSLNTKCSFATKWKSRPGRMGGEGSMKTHPWQYIIKDEYEYASNTQPKSAQRHFRFDARPLFYAAKPVSDEKLYAGYKYPEDLNQDEILNPKDDLKFLHDKATNEKLIENKAIFFPNNYKSSVTPLEIEARDADNQPILGYKANLTGIMTSIYARDDELQKTKHATLNGVDKDWIQNCFDSNICRSVWANLNPNANKTANTLDGLAFVYSDIFDGKRYLAYNNKGETFLRLGDSEQTIFSQNNKTTHSNTPEALCDLGEPKSLCSDKDVDCKDFREKGGLYSCDTIVVDSTKVGKTKQDLDNLAKNDSFFERKGLKFYNFNPAMMKINTVLGNKSITNTSPYSSDKFTYHRAPCASYSNPDKCSDEVENASFKIQVGATGVNKADILANNFLSRYDGKAIAPNEPEKNLEFRGNLAAPVIVHVRNRNNSSPTNDFRFKLTSEQFKTMSLLLAPRCDILYLSSSKPNELVCQKGDQLNENHYLAVATGATLEPASIKMHNMQTNYQNLLGNKSGTLDLKVFKGSFEKGVVELKNINRTTTPNQETGLLFGQKSGDYSLKEKEPVVVKIKAQKAEVPENDENKWLKEQKLSAMVDVVGGAAVLDVVLVAPNKQVGGNAGDLKDNAVFLAAYSSNPSVAKELQDAEILGDIIPGYANYYRIRRDAFGNDLLNNLFDYSYDGGSLAGNNIIAVGKTTADVKQSGDFLRVPAGKQVSVKLKGDDTQAQMYCNFIRNCYPLPGGGYGTVFTGYDSKDAKWHGTGDKGKTIIDESIDKTRTRPTQRRLVM